jgi:hypothetical protein
VTFIGLSLAGGWWIWQNTSSQPRSDIIRMTWMIACPAFALAVISNFGRVLLYATNQVNVLQFLSTCAFSLQAVVSIGGILAGFGIQALVAANLCMFSILALSLFTTRFLPGNLGLVGPWQHGDRSVIHGLLRTSAGTFCNNLATYTVLNANVLIASHFLPIAEIASYGITLQIGMICSQVSTIWLEVKQPLFAQWTRTNPEALQKIFISRMRLALLSYCGTITVAIIIGPHLLSMIGARTPLLPLGPFIALALLLLVVMHHSQFESVCLGVGHNPFIPAYLTSAGAGAFFAISFARDLGIWALILGPLAAQLAWNSWWVPRQGLQKLQLAPFQYLRRLAIPKWNDFNI